MALADTLDDAPALWPDALPLDSILCGDALAVLRTLPDNSVDAIVTDPPYFRVKGEAWDRQWDNAASFLGWLATMADEWRRVLKPNGSLYCFASPQMAARVEVMLGERFTVLNHIIWRKEAGHHKAAHKEGLRGYFPITERIIFCEQQGADSMASGESGYATQCERLHGFVFEPLRAYLDGERKRAGITQRQVIAHLSMTGHDPHFFKPIQWKLPLAVQYAALQRLFNAQPGGPYLTRTYDNLRRQYDNLRRQYESLRRPFAVTADVPYTDVWDFAPVAYRPGKHPCEKPLDLLRHIIRSSTRPDALILDCFAGSGATCEAAALEGRRYLGIERDTGYVLRARHRLSGVTPAAPLPVIETTRHKQHRQRTPARSNIIRPSLWADTTL